MSLRSLDFEEAMSTQIAVDERDSNKASSDFTSSSCEDLQQQQQLNTDLLASIGTPTNEELRHLLTSHDSYLQEDMDRRARRYQQDIASLKAEMASLQRNRKEDDVEQPCESDVGSSEFLDDVPEMRSKVESSGVADDLMVNGDIVRISGDDDDEEEREGIDLPLLPEDTFTYLAFSRWNSTSLFIAVCVVGVQVVTLSVLALDFASQTLPGNQFGVPVSVNARTATIQVIALGIIIFSQGDLQDSLNLLFMGYDKAELQHSIRRPVPYARWLVSLWTRLLVTMYGLIITFVMIVRESDVTELLLDFTSIEFVTNIDNIFFWLTAWYVYSAYRLLEHQQCCIG